MDARCSTSRSPVTRILLLFLLLPAFPAGAAGATAADAGTLAEMHEMLAQQQQAISRLLQNQKRQDEEIRALKAQLESRQALVGSADDSEVDASYQIEPEAEQRAEAPEPASSIPLKVLPGKARFSVGGHINRAVNLADDGNETDTYHVDSGSVPTLTYVKAYLPVNEHLTLGGHIEYALQNNSASLVSQDNLSPGFTTSARNFEMTLDSSRYGKLWFGRGLMASFLAVELDKSETWRYNILSPGNTFGGLKFVDTRDDGLSDLSVASVFLDAEAFNRKDRIRYDSPVLGGFRVSGSVGTADSSALALRWNGKLGDLDLTAGFSTQNNPVQGRVSDRIDGGVALYHADSGLSLTVAGADQDYKRSFYQNFGRSDGDNSGYGVRLGWRRPWFEPGETRLALDYFSSDDVLYESDDSESFGLFISQNIDAWSLEPYFGYRFYDYDPGPNAGGLALEKVHVWTFGARMALDLSIH